MESCLKLEDSYEVVVVAGASLKLEGKMITVPPEMETAAVTVMNYIAYGICDDENILQDIQDTYNMVNNATGQKG